MSSEFAHPSLGSQIFFQVFPATLKPLYFKQGEKINNARYLPREIRENLMLRVKKECSK